jgi:hypothetical protein
MAAVGLVRFNSELVRTFIAVDDRQAGSWSSDKSVQKVVRSCDPLTTLSGIAATAVEGRLS